MKTLQRGLKMLSARPNSFEDCVRVARLRFEAYFANGPKQLLHLFPATHMVKDPVTHKEALFWSPPKTPPLPLVFDANDPLHLAFIESCANLHAAMWGAKSAVRDRGYIRDVVSRVEVPVFVPRR